MKASRPGALRHGRTDRSAEQIRVQEVPDVRRAEHVVTRRPILDDRHLRLSETARRPVERTQHVIQPEEHRDLSKHRQTAQDRVEPVLALQLLHLERHALTVLAVLLLQRLDLWLQLLHLASGADLAHERLVEQCPQREDEEHHRQCPREKVRGPQQRSEQLVPNPHDPRHRVVDEVEAKQIKRQKIHSPLAAPGHPRRRWCLQSPPGNPGVPRHVPVSGPILPDAMVRIWRAGLPPASSPESTRIQ